MALLVELMDISAAREIWWIAERWSWLRQADLPLLPNNAII
jgi:hypothetical protein